MQLRGVPWNRAMLSEEDVECASGQPWCPPGSSIPEYLCTEPGRWVSGAVRTGYAWDDKTRLGGLVDQVRVIFLGLVIWPVLDLTARAAGYAADLMSAAETAKVALTGKALGRNRVYFEPRTPALVQAVALKRKAGCVCELGDRSVHHTAIQRSW